MTAPIATPRTRWLWGPVIVAAILGLIVAVSLAASFFRTSTNPAQGADDPLFHDPMANVQAVGATRIDRTVHRPTPPTSTSKGNPDASVLMAFQTAGPRSADIAVRDDLVRQAKAAGWIYKSDMPEEEGLIFGYKTIAGQTARLGVAFSSTEQNVVLVHLIYSAA